jgi:hypothetical protein
LAQEEGGNREELFDQNRKKELYSKM